MDLLGGYGSSDEERGTSSRAISPSPGKRKLRLDYSKLPVSRPLQTSVANRQQPEQEPDAGLLEIEAARASAAAARPSRVKRSKMNSPSPDRESTCSESSEADSRDDACPTAGATWLPPPKQQPAMPGQELVIDFSTAGRPKEKPQVTAGANAWLVKAASIPDVEEKECALPADILKHPMLRNARATPDGPPPEEVDFLKSNPAKLKRVNADDMRDPDWQLTSLLEGQPGLLRGGRVPSAASAYDSDKWQSTAHANPSRVQKRKHHINWLASVAIEQEAELLDRAASGRLTKAQTLARYGW
eukprot:TRINITY_DN36293_c0_g1_i1.p1 TRINITY_DN36293_c0_g1~~TRINITY_DN36293_c0_g1_i1.p1  ORF type:complete len:311 (-),score=72.01 TRINITY_DN36293_c0_g1_i1:38-940(-)